MPWILTALACVVLEALMLWTLEGLARTRHGPALRFWLAAGGYTTAVVATEFYLGPPVLYLTDLFELATRHKVDDYQGSFFYSGLPEAAIYAAQIALWIAALVWILVARARRRGMAASRCAVLACSAVVLLVLLYAAAFQYIGWAIVWGLDRLGVMRI